MSASWIRPLAWLAALLLIGASPGEGQRADDLRLESGSYRQVRTASDHRWVELADAPASLDRRRLVSELESLLPAGSRLVETRAWQENGRRHAAYRQEVAGVPVEGAEWIVHSSGDRLDKANGRLVTTPLDPVPVVNRRQAESTALERLRRHAVTAPSRRGRFEVAETRLVFALTPPAGEAAARQHRLSWRVRVAEAGGDAVDLFVDARSGRLLKERPVTLTCTPLFGETTWHGSRPIHTEAGSDGFALIDRCEALHDFTFKTSKSTPSAVYTSPSGVFGAATRSAVTAHWGTHAALDYFRTRHGRDGFDGKGGEIQVLNERASFWGGKNNASWHPSGQLSFGPGNTDSPFDDWNTVDVAGHELAHGVTGTTADLIYESESGALNESFSDIFGVAIERFAEGGANPDWLIAEDRVPLPKLLHGIRSLENPGLFDHPKIYGGSHWVPVVGCQPSLLNDQCGVHTNSGVQNHWFFLLVEGSFGHLAFPGIGLEKAAAIAYRNLETYLTPGAGYPEAAAGAIESAIDLYGGCSQEVRSTRDAWRFVAVPTPDYELVGWSGTICDLSGSVYAAVDRLTAGGAGCPAGATVPAGQSVILTAGDEVVLAPGFAAAAGASTRILAGDCAP